MGPTLSSLVELQAVEQNLQTEDNIDWVSLAQTDPTEYAVKKAEHDRKNQPHD